MEKPVDELRDQLRQLGYLSHGIERWFALDPWSSRTFWRELTLVASKAALLVALFFAVPLVSIMLIRNHPLSISELLAILILYFGTGFIATFLLLVATALMLRLSASAAVDRPGMLMAISMALTTLLIAAIAVWWRGFEQPAARIELIAGVALLFLLFMAGTIVVSAALLTFSIYESRRVPRIHQRSRTMPILVAGGFLLAVLVVIPFYTSEAGVAAGAPIQVVTTPRQPRIVLLAVDGLTYEIFSARNDLTRGFASIGAVDPLPMTSSAGRWASAGTGTPSSLHAVRAIEGIRIRSNTGLIQSVSRHDFPLLDLAPMAGIAQREPLPPTARRRDYVWEILRSRGFRIHSINWWATDDHEAAGSKSIGQDWIFAAAAKRSAGNSAAMALEIDRSSAEHLLNALESGQPHLAAAYLPSLDILVNRLPLGANDQLTASVRSLDLLSRTIEAIRKTPYEVVLVGMPGDRQEGRIVIASSGKLAGTHDAFDLAPTLLDLFGFPASNEMMGRSLVPESRQPRIPTYGASDQDGKETAFDEEYFRNLKALGYIR